MCITVLYFVTVVRLINTAASTAQPAACYLSIRANEVTGAITSAVWKCRGGKVAAAVDDNLLEASASFIGISFDRKCITPGCLITICSNTRAVFTDSEVRYVGAGIHSALCVANTSTVAIKNSTFKYNSARAILALHHANVTVQSCMIAHNAVVDTNGGGLRIDDDAKLYVNESVVRRNRVLNGGGGGVFAGSKANLTVEASTINGNSCGSYGGGVFAAANSTVVINGSIIENNKCGSGGGLYAAQQSAVVVEDSVFRQNACSSRGGGMAASGAAVIVMQGDSLKGNVASQYGGGVSLVDNANLTMLGAVSFRQNQVQRPEPTGYDVAAFDNSTLSLHAVSGVTQCSPGMLLATNTCSAGMVHNVKSGTLSPTQCLCCPPLTYSVSIGSNGMCKPCPDSALCPGGNVLQPLPGYWRSSVHSDRIQQCPLYTVACAGNDTCQPGYKGNLCGMCASGYGITSPMKCVRCSQAQVPPLGVVLYILMVCGCATAIATTVQFTVKAAKNRAALGQTREAPFTTTSKQGLPIFAVIKILVRFMQYLVIIGSVPVLWARALQTFFLVCALVLGAALDKGFGSFSWDCMLPYMQNPALVRQVIALIAPFAVFPLILALLVLMWAMPGQLDLWWHHRLPTLHDFKLYMRLRVPIAAIVVVYYAYPTLVRVSLGCFACLRIDSLDGSTYWTGDIQHKCYASPHVALAVGMGIPCTLMFCAVVPVTVLVKLRHSRAALGSPRFYRLSTFLYGEYKESGMWWEVVWTVQTVLMCLISVFQFTLGAYYTLLLLIVAFLVGAVLQIWFKPYQHQKLHNIQLASTLCLLLTGLGAQAMLPGGRAAASATGTSIASGVAAFAITLNACFMVYCFIAVVDFTSLKALLKTFKLVLLDVASRTQMLLGCGS